MRALSTVGMRRSVSLNFIIALFFCFTALLQVIGAEKVVRKSAYPGNSASRNVDIHKQLDDNLAEKETRQAKGHIIPPSSYQSSDNRRRSVAKEDIENAGSRGPSVESYAGDVPSPIKPEDSLATIANPIVNPPSTLFEQAENSARPVDPFTGTTRSLSDWKLEDLYIAISMNGKITASNRTTGIHLWNVTSNNIWNVTRHFEPDDDNENDLDWIIEPGNGGTLYSHSLSNGLQKGALQSMKYICDHSAYQARNGMILKGTKDTDIYTINPLTGEFLSTSSGSITNGLPDKCVKRTRLEGLDDETDEECTVRKVSLSRTDYTVEISHDEKGRLWTLRYTEWGIGSQNVDLANQYTSSFDNKYFFRLPSGLLICRDIITGKEKFQARYDEAVAQAFDLASNVHDNTLVLLPHPKAPSQDFGRRILASLEGGSGVFALPDLSLQDGSGISSDAVTLPNKKWYSMGLKERRDALQGKRTIKGFQAPLHLEGPSSDSNTSQRSDPHVGSGAVPKARGEPLKDNSALQVVALVIMMSLMWFAGRHSTDLSLAIRRFRQKLPSPLQSGTTRQILDISPNTPMIKETFTNEEVQQPIAPEPVPIQIETEVKEVQVVLKEELPPQLATEIENQATPDDFVVVPVPQIVPPNKKVVTFADANEAEVKEDQEGGSDNEEQNDGDKSTAPSTPKKGRKRGARGNRKRKKKTPEAETEEKKMNVSEPEDLSGGKAGVSIIRNPEVLVPDENGNGQVAEDLFVTNTVLGYGSHGTRVFKGKFGDREVAVKRLFVDSYDLASHEVNLLQKVDDHPNVVRYFCQKQTSLFLYIALELCPASLHDVFETPQHAHILELMNPPEVLRQMTMGVQHLHSLKIVHRDIKPQNILVAEPKRSLRDPTEIKHPKILISDFGLCKKLEADQSSFRATTAHAAGTSGWRAPELLIGEAGDATISSLSEHTNGSTSDSSVLDTLTNRRATRAIDIFSLGCVFYFVLTGGGHPFGDRYLREGNIITGKFNLSGLEVLGDSGSEASDLIASMIARNPKARPDATTVLTHPFFWSAEKKLNFLLDVSDRFEKEERDPPSPLLQKLESYAKPTFNGDWYKKLDKGLIDNLGKHRKYQGDRMLDLLRALRNKKHHYQDLPPAVQVTVGQLPDGYLSYFTSRFPSLLVNMFHLVRDEIQDEAMWRTYFTS
ncbi:bifunctional endoribonuclease/protein kinase ire1 [Orbilia blumenaviensis]|uniref:non-specific serine/threonine protein kinase n=1 Tax=Orbilia blumenaviensis TaxID=1796055 RepID=A0AAV9VLJ2_9PEZI